MWPTTINRMDRNRALAEDKEVPNSTQFRVSFITSAVCHHASGGDVAPIRIGLVAHVL